MYICILKVVVVVVVYSTFLYIYPHIFPAKYVTGGGMKQTTANRVFVLHKEGNMPYRHRGHAQAKKKKKAKSDFDEEDDGEDDCEDNDDEDFRAKVSPIISIDSTCPMYVCMYVCM